MRVIERSAATNGKLAVVISCIFVALQIQMSLRAGTLGLPPTYDDVGYFVDAARRIGEFLSGGLAEVIKGYISNPPHSPGSTFLAALGFMLFGMNAVAAAISNAIPLFVVSFALLQLCNQLPRWVAAVTVSSLLLIPI